MHRRDDLHLKRKKKAGLLGTSVFINSCIPEIYPATSSQCSHTMWWLKSKKGKLTSSFLMMDFEWRLYRKNTNKVGYERGKKTREEKFKKIVGWVGVGFGRSLHHPTHTRTSLIRPRFKFNFLTITRCWWNDMLVKTGARQIRLKMI